MWILESQAKLKKSHTKSTEWGALIHVQCPEQAHPETANRLQVQEAVGREEEMIPNVTGVGGGGRGNEMFWS